MEHHYRSIATHATHRGACCEWTARKDAAAYAIAGEAAHNHWAKPLACPYFVGAEARRTGVDAIAR